MNNVNFLQHKRLIGTIDVCIIYLVGPTTDKNLSFLYILLLFE